jgi:transposase
MNRFKRYEPKQNMFLPINIDKNFPPGCFERFLVDTIDKFEINQYAEKDDKGGETPYNPKALLGLIFYGYASGIFSSRKLEDACQNDIRYMYVSGFCTPDHSTISRFINNNEKENENIFTKILYIADENGFIDYKLIATDGTKIKANASKRFTGTLERFRKRKELYTKKIKLAIEKQKAADKGEEIDYWQKKEKRYKKNLKKIEEFLEGAKEIKNHKDQEIQQNITDPDCRVVKTGMIHQEAYNAQASVCGKSGIIVGADLGNEEADYSFFHGMIKKVEEQAPKERQKKCKEAKYLFDNGYHKTKNVVEAMDLGLDVYMPDVSDKNLFLDQKPKGKRTLIGIGDCTIKKNKSFFSVICPGGIELTDYKIAKVYGKQYYAFHVKDFEKCKSCKYFERCRGKNKHKNVKAFRILKIALDNYDKIQTYNKRMRSDEGKRIYSRRSDVAEKVFAHIKANMGFREFLRRGLEKVKNNWITLCCAYNLKRIYALNKGCTVK